MKISKHPVGTFIHIEGEGHYEKVEKGLWRHVNGDGEDIPRFLTNKYIKNIDKTEPNRIQILAAPWRVVVELMRMVMDEYGHRDAEGNLITFDSVYKDAIARDEETQQIKEHNRVLHLNYCAADAALTQGFYDRVLRPSVIYKKQRM